MVGWFPSIYTHVFSSFCLYTSVFFYHAVRVFSSLVVSTIGIVVIVVS